jgi:uncharacterized protein YndB with AHSA1/START domain
MIKTNFVVDKKNLEVRMSRVLDAPTERVWQAHVDPKAITQWWGPRRFVTEVEKLDARVGGQWRFINKDAAGNRHVFYGKFREIQKPTKIAWTFTYEPYPQSVIEETLTLEALPDGKTRLSTVSRYPSLEALEGMVQGGMEAGARETWDRLAELVAH